MLYVQLSKKKTCQGSGETFEIIEGEVNKRTKYWKFIALYENSLKKVKGKMNEKRLVQVSTIASKNMTRVIDEFSKIFWEISLSALISP